MSTYGWTVVNESLTTALGTIIIANAAEIQKTSNADDARTRNPVRLYKLPNRSFFLQLLDYSMLPQ